MTPRAVRAAVAPAASISNPWERIKSVLPFLGPAFVASVAYMDPGNFATNIQAGAKFGYMLLWVLVASNLMAILIQSLSAKLGIASGLTLPQAIAPTRPGGCGSACGWRPRQPRWRPTWPSSSAPPSACRSCSASPCSRRRS